MVPSNRGTLIAIEGIDGSGKRTQLRLLHSSLLKEGRPHRLFAFPRYTESFLGELIARYLKGEFGESQRVSPYLSALMFAGDRFEARREILEELESGALVVSDRYVGSNLAYQAAKLPPQERPTFRRWLERLEYGVYRIPRPTLVVYFHVPVDLAAGLMEGRALRQERGRLIDLYERDLGYLRAVSEEFQELARTSSSWVQIDVADSRGLLRDPIEVHQEFLGYVWRHASLDDAPNRASGEGQAFRKGRRILGVDQRVVSQAFGSRRFVPAGVDADYVRKILLSHATPLPREEAEEDLSEKQLVSCAVIRCKDRFALFKRSWNGNRRQMQLRFSLLTGGHVNFEDSVGGDAFADAIERELREELALPEEFALGFAGFVNDDRNLVARTHLCAVYWLDVRGQGLKMKPAGAAEYEEEDSLRFATAQDVSQLRGRLDPWSEILLEELIGIPATPSA